MFIDHPSITDEERTPPDAVIEAANYGIALRREHKRGGTEVGLNRALRLSRGERVSDRDIITMNAWFARHAVDKRGKFWGHPTKPSAGYIAWHLWGGDAAQDWIAPLRERLRAFEI
ncbi:MULTISPECIES: hypothetical protein [unclassified Brevundimonas]|uniref:hypothetical protein n=1 Tax=unclassified Brevundimonas TaxID=2622653 RepID=UPI0025C0D374|nr:MULTISPECIES: hypothetical protein [unclassified Brevundimonas]